MGKTDWNIDTLIDRQGSLADAHCSHHESVPVSFTAEGMGLPSDEDRLSIGPTAPEI